MLFEMNGLCSLFSLSRLCQIDSVNRCDSPFFATFVDVVVDDEKKKKIDIVKIVFVRFTRTKMPECVLCVLSAVHVVFVFLYIIKINSSIDNRLPRSIDT